MKLKTLKLNALKFHNPPPTMEKCGHSRLEDNVVGVCAPLVDVQSASSKSNCGKAPQSTLA